jgi:phosphoglycolate phosphatase
MRLVLWDIDGTLLDSAGHGREAFGVAFERTVGRPPTRLPRMAGRTDHDIALETLAVNGVDDGERLWPEFAGALAEALSERAEPMRRDGRARAGAHTALAAMASVDGVVQSVLTGNLQANAATKLKAFGLVEHLDLAVGAYGSDDRERSELVAIARGRARAAHGDEPAETVLVGDTPLDVAAGRSAGARVVGVATGPHSVDELVEARAEPVLSDLRDTEAVLDAVLGARPEAVAR